MGSLEKNLDFSYPEYIFNTTEQCIDRKRFNSEFARIFDKNIDITKNNTPHVLIVGRNTVLGSALKRIFVRENIPFVSVKGINEIDFSSNDTYKVLDTVNIKEAYIVYQPPLIRHTFSDGFHYINYVSTKYIEGISKYLHQKNVKFIFGAPQPVFENIARTILKFNASVIEMPFLIDSKAIKDLENPTMRAVRECKKVGYTNIEFLPFTKYQSITSDEAAEFIIKQFHDQTTGKHILFQGHSSLNVDEAIKTVIQSQSLSNCILNFRNYSHKINISSNFDEIIYNDNNKNVNIKSILQSEYKNFQIGNDNISKPYLSIVVGGRHDNYSNGFEKRAENFLKSIDYGLKYVPLANIEIVFVDYATPLHNSLLSDTISVPLGLKGKIRFIIVPPNIHKMLNTRLNSRYAFFEYIAKNIGIRRSKGKFILATNGDCLFSTEFFEIVSTHQFNTAIYYRSLRWNLRSDTLNKNNITMNELISFISETWKLKNINVDSWCKTNDRFAIFDSCETYKIKAEPCAPGDFTLLSKVMWNISQGFNEVPANPGTDTVFIARMMKLLPGYPRMYLLPVFLHQSHEPIGFRRIGFENEKQVRNEYCCIGRCPSCKPYYDRDDWGLSNYNFEEIIK